MLLQEEISKRNSWYFAARNRTLMCIAVQTWQYNSAYSKNNFICGPSGIVSKYVLLNCTSDVIYSVARGRQSREHTLPRSRWCCWCRLWTIIIAAAAAPSNKLTLLSLQSSSSAIVTFLQHQPLSRHSIWCDVTVRRHASFLNDIHARTCTQYRYVRVNIIATCTAYRYCVHVCAYMYARVNKLKTLLYCLPVLHTCIMYQYARVNIIATCIAYMYAIQVRACKHHLTVEHQREDAGC